MGADVIVSGLQDAVVETMIELGMTLENIRAVLDLDDALALSRTVQRTEAHMQALNGHDLDWNNDWNALDMDSLHHDPHNVAEV
jgi:DNA-binding transcriptional MerR regulator